MAIYKMYECSCDECGAVEHHTGTRKGAIEMLRESGWTVGQQILCPDCKTNPQS